MLSSTNEPKISPKLVVICKSVKYGQLYNILIEMELSRTTRVLGWCVGSYYYT